jgi:cyclic peptide transporter
MDSVDETVGEIMDEGDIPGLALVIVDRHGNVHVKGYGFRDQEAGEPVTEDTMFELASCSKAFTALAVLDLNKKGKLDLEAPVSRYLSWFKMSYDGKNHPITIRQLLHHTSGIPWKSVDAIAAGDGDDALEQAVRAAMAIELKDPPGRTFSYATLNYDILGLIVQTVSGVSYEEYMKRNVFLPLGMTATTAGKGTSGGEIAAGYKIGFFGARSFDAPVYRGNTPAGYILSSGKDMGQWLLWNLGILEPESDWHGLLGLTHQKNDNVALSKADLSSYGMGWQIYMDGSRVIDHAGDNPNFASYMGFDTHNRTAVALLANSNSRHAHALGKHVLGVVSGKKPDYPSMVGDNMDKAASVISVVLTVFFLSILVFLFAIPVELAKKKRAFAPLTFKTIAQWVAGLLILLPFLVAVYLIPFAMGGVSWATAIVWSPVSFTVAVWVVLACIGAGYLSFVLATLFPQNNKYVRSMPLVIVLSLLAGGANALVIFLISSSLFSDMGFIYQVYFFALAFLVSILGRKVLETRLIKLTYDIVYDLRMRLIHRVFRTSYQRFEQIERGRIYATLNDDTNQIGNFAGVIVQLATSVITTLGAFIYLATLAFWATLITLGVIAAIGVLYSYVGQQAQVYFNRARDTRNVFMGLVNGLLDGFKELSLSVNKKREFRGDVETTCDEFRKQITTAMVKFINAFLVGESFLIIVLGAVGFGIPRVFPDISTFTLMSFIMILLYLIGPINGILNSIPTLTNIKISWDRIKGFEKDIPANIDPAILEKDFKKPQAVEALEAHGLEYQYHDKNGDQSFSVGPIDFSARKGEITFIIGGNGSGKTTLAKLLTGLYNPEKGTVSVKNGDQDEQPLGEYYSTVFSNYHLFNKLYNVNLDGREGEISEHLKTLRLEEKVNIDGDSFSTIDLSGGQRKRLALMLCYLENSPIYLFDEIAADQDPEFRKFFYRDLLPRMKAEGKIVIAITHDDHYFDVADKIVKMDMGKIETVQRPGAN